MGFKKLGNTTNSLLGVVNERRKAGGVDVIGYATGFHQLDTWTGGLQPDTLTIIGAATSVGKSSFALSIALNLAKQGKVVLYSSLEMGNSAIAFRLLSQLTGIDKDKIVKGKLTPQEFERVVEASRSLQELPLMISAKSDSSDSLITSVMNFHKDIEPVEALFVDYMGLLVDGGNFGQHERLTAISSKMRQLARPESLNAPVIALVQLTKAVEQREDKRPNLGDIRDSGSPAQDAENVWLLYRPAHYDRMRGQTPAIEDNAEIIVAKNREGMVGTMMAQYVPSRAEWIQNKPESPMRPAPIRVGGR